MNQKRLTITISAAITIAIVGFLFLVPTETGLSFAASDSGGSNSDKSGQTSDSGSGKQQQQQQQQVPMGGLDKPDVFPNPLPTPKPGWIKHPWWLWKQQQPIKVVVHTKTVHDGGSSASSRNLTVTQQNCIAAALQLGFSNNDVQNRANATYAAILGCFS